MAELQQKVLELQEKNTILEEKSQCVEKVSREIQTSYVSEDEEDRFITIDEVTEESVFNEDFGNTYGFTPSITILSDSHGRYISSILKAQGLQASSIVKPGARAFQVLRSVDAEVKSMGLGDVLVVLCGSNDVHSEKGMQQAKSAFTELFRKEVSQRLLVCTVPYNYSTRRPEVNRRIRDLNDFLYASTRGRRNIQLLSLNEVLHRDLYTRHGLHYNIRGKKELAKLIARSVEPLYRSTMHRSSSVSCNQDHSPPQEPPKTPPGYHHHRKIPPHNTNSFL